MASHSSSHLTKGFTLIEVMIVIAFVAIAGAGAVFFGADTYRAYLFHSDRDLLVVALQHTRAQAIGNICLGNGCSDGKPHGVAILPDRFVMFQGSCYASPCVRDPDDVAVDADIEANPNLIHTGTMEIVFTQLSATTTGGTVTLKDSTNGRKTVITVLPEGQITWDDSFE